MIVDYETSLTFLNLKPFALSEWSVHVIESLFSFPLSQTCALKAVKNVVAMVSVPSPTRFRP